MADAYSLEIRKSDGAIVGCQVRPSHRESLVDSGARDAQGRRLYVRTLEPMLAPVSVRTDYEFVDVDESAFTAARAAIAVGVSEDNADYVATYNQLAPAVSVTDTRPVLRFSRAGVPLQRLDLTHDAAGVAVVLDVEIVGRALNGTKLLEIDGFGTLELTFIAGISSVRVSPKVRGTFVLKDRPWYTVEHGPLILAIASDIVEGASAGAPVEAGL